MVLKALFIQEFMPIQIMNIKADIDGDIDEDDTLKSFVLRGHSIIPYVGDNILHSDGSLLPGYINPDLVTKEGVFNISKYTTDFLWNDGKDMTSYEHFYFVNNQLYFGTPEVNRYSFYNNPIYNIHGLYKNIGSAKSLDEKINFLESFLGARSDKSGFYPKDSIIKNNETRLKLLEQNYKNNMDRYALIPSQVY